MRAAQRIKHYVLEQRLGGGGMADVWIALDANTNRRVAIKIMSGPLASSQQFQQRFLLEAERHSRLIDPHIVRCLDYFTEDGVSCIVLDYVEGESLKDRLQREPVLPIDQSLEIVSQMLSALNYAHQRGVIHRDVKPGNVLLDRAGNVYLIDFGIAIAIGEMRLTRGERFLGTPDYSSPEQLLRPRSVDHRTDVYSAGVVLYEMLAGRLPHIVPEGSEDSDFALTTQIVNTEPKPPSAWNPGIPPALDDIVMKALAKDRDQRLAGCGIFREELLAYRASPGQKRSARKTHKPRGQINRAVLVLLTLALDVLVIAKLNGDNPIYFSLMLIQMIIQLAVVYRSWSNIQDGSTSAGAGWASLSMLIPLVAVSAWFRSYFGYARQYNRFLERNHVQCAKIGAAQPLFFIYGILSIPVGMFGLLWPLIVAGVKFEPRDRDTFEIYLSLWILSSIATAVVMAGANNRLVAAKKG